MTDTNSQIEVRRQQRTPFIWIDKNIYTKYAGQAEFGSASLAVYIALSFHADNDTRSAYPAISTLAKNLGLSINTVRKAVINLTAWGLIKVDERISPAGEHASHIYTILEVPETPVRKESEDKKEGTSKIEGGVLQNLTDGTSEFEGGVLQNLTPNYTNSNYTQGTIGTVTEVTVLHSPESVSVPASNPIDERLGIPPRTKSKNPAKAKKAKEPKPTPAPRPRDPVLDAMCQLMYGTQDAWKTRSNPPLIRRAVNDIRAIRPDLTADLIAAFSKWYFANDWRGQRGERPSAWEMPALWFKFAESSQPPSEELPFAFSAPEPSAYVEIDLMELADGMPQVMH